MDPIYEGTCHNCGRKIRTTDVYRTQFGTKYLCHCDYKPPSMNSTEVAMHLVDDDLAARYRDSLLSAQ